ncbi:MAG: S8 family serine peptidase [Nitrospirae bacterium]|nr:S8 family serine peptidase [Nitrospirota bacterium]
MKIKCIFLAAIMFISLSLVPDSLNAAEYMQGEVLVKFKQSTSQQAINAANNKVQAALKKKMHVLTSSEASVMKLPSNVSVMQAVYEYKKDPNVEYAQPNYIYRRALTPNDPSYGSLWGLNNIGQTVNSITGSLDADIDAPTAWNITTGSASVVIAVIDTGVKLTHADLSTNIWGNSGETASNSVDDDNNGYVDDVNGWDFVNNDNNPADDCGHGTHVAGIIAAVGNNAIGITGVMWTAKIMPLKALGIDAECSGTTQAITEAIYYAVNKGAKIINLSLGSSINDIDGMMQEAINYARNNNVLVVAAAGNDSTDNDTTAFYPANFNVDNIISVAATDQNDALASFSNYGKTTVDLAAPGVNIYSTVPTTAECTLSSDSCDDSGYAFSDGTSMAAPHVAGAAGLIWAANPAYTYTQVKNAILNNVNKLVCLSDKMVTGGRLNAYQALSGLASLASPATLSATRTSGTQMDLSWADVTGETGYEIYRRLCSAACSTYVLINTTGAGVIAYSDTGLTPDACYKYVARAFNAADVSDHTAEAPADPPDGSGGHARNCFIATAAYGSPMHPYVEALRIFRDAHLLSNYLGSKFVDMYYKFSPPIADVIRDSEPLKSLTRLALAPVIMVVVYPYVSLTAFLAIIFSSLFVLRMFKRQRG